MKLVNGSWILEQACTASALKAAAVGAEILDEPPAPQLAPGL